LELAAERYPGDEAIAANRETCLTLWLQSLATTITESKTQQKIINIFHWILAGKAARGALRLSAMLLHWLKDHKCIERAIDSIVANKPTSHGAALWHLSFARKVVSFFVSMSAVTKDDVHKIWSLLVRLHEKDPPHDPKGTEENR